MGDGDHCEDAKGPNDFFDASDDALIGSQLPLYAASESGLMQVTNLGGSISHQATLVELICAISSDLAEFDEEECQRVRPPIPATPLEPAPPAFPPSIIAKIKSSSNTKSRKRKEARVNVPFPSDVADAAPKDRPWRAPQVSMPRARRWASVTSRLKPTCSSCMALYFHRYLDDYSRSQITE